MRRPAVGSIVPVIAVLIVANAAAGQTQRNQTRKLPPAVAKAVDANRPGAEIEKLTIEKEHGLTFYDFEFKHGQGEMDVLVDGTVLDVATVIQMKDLPEVVAATIRKVAGKRTIKQLTRSEVRAEIVSEGGRARVATLSPAKYVYEAEFAGEEVEVAGDGTIIKRGK